MLRIFRKLYPLTVNDNLQPFFIVGSGRSGSTLLRKMIMCNDGVYIPPETYFLGSSIKLFKKYNHLPWKILCNIILSELVKGSDFEFFPTNNMRDLYVEISNLNESNRSLSAVFDTIYMYLSKSAGRNNIKIWGDKTPINSFHIYNISDVFPKSKYVHIVRDGCDVVTSIVNMRSHPSSIEQAAERWVSATEICREFGRKHPDRYYEIRYEDMIRDAHSEIAKLCSFLGIEYHERMIFSVPDVPLGDVEARAHHKNVLAPINATSIGKGRAKLTSQERKLIQHKMDPLLVALGYPPVSSRYEG